jgi:C-terminal processing protease CtpA/Prc
MKKSLVVSFVLHLLVVVTLLFNFKNTYEEQLEQETKQEQAEGSESFEVDIIEQNPLSNQDIIEKDIKNHYWGLGITVDFSSADIIPFGNIMVYVVSMVYSGYCGESIGLEVGDTIYLINGKPIRDNNEIMGFKPRKLSLTIIKKRGTIINIETERCKVWY